MSGEEKEAERVQRENGKKRETDRIVGPEKTKMLSEGRLG